MCTALILLGSEGFATHLDMKSSQAVLDSVVNDPGEILRIVTNDPAASAQEIADPYKQPRAIAPLFRWANKRSRSSPFWERPTKPCAYESRRRRLRSCG
jgi:hypothetical protein